jgi:hypothetical protein
MEEEFEPVARLEMEVIAYSLGDRCLAFIAEGGFHDEDSSLYILEKVKRSCGPRNHCLSNGSWNCNHVRSVEELVVLLPGTGSQKARPYKEMRVQ